MGTGAKGEHDLNFLVQNTDTGHSGGSPILELSQILGTEGMSKVVPALSINPIYISSQEVEQLVHTDQAHAMS